MKNGKIYFSNIMTKSLDSDYTKHVDIIFKHQKKKKS